MGGQMNIYNVGLTTDNGMSIGYHVVADNADAALKKARAHAEQQVTLQGGGLVQRRDPNGNNGVFDSAFRLAHGPDEFLT
jgi:hypothetical protein